MNGLLDKEDNKIQDDSDAKFNDGAAFDYDKEFNNIVDNELNDLNMRKTDEMSDPSGNGPKYNTSGGNGYDAGGSPTINVNFKAKYTVPLVAAGSLGMAGIIGFNTIAPGPAQFLQMGELLQDFHLKDSEEFTNSRATQAWRYARDPNNPQNRRLSELGKKHAAVLDTNMAKAGYTMEFDGRGQLKRMVIDTEKTGLDPEKTRAKYEKAGINAGNITPEGKTIYIDNLNNDGWHPFRNSDIFRSALIDSGYGDTVSRIHNRTLKKRAKLHYNPAKALTDYIDNKVKDFVGSQKEKAVAKKDAWVESRKTYTSDGADIAGFAADDKKGSVTEPDGTVKPTDVPENVAAADEINTLATADSAPAAKTGITKGLTAAGGLSFAVGLGCMLHSIGKSAAELSYANVMLPTMRLGMEIVSIKGQIEAGLDPDMTMLGYYAENFFQEKQDPTPEAIAIANEANSNAGYELDEPVVAEGIPASSWVDANDIKHELGQEQDGFDPPPELEYDTSNVITDVTGKIPGIDEICNITGSWVGTGVLFALDVASGGSSVLIGTAVSLVAGPPIISWVTNWLANEAVDTAKAGAGFGSYSNFGVMAAGSQAFIGKGGTPLSSQEVSAWKRHNMDRLKYAQAEKPVLDRLFDKTDARSFVSSFARVVPRNKIAAISSTIKSPLSFLSSMKFLVPGSTTYAIAAEPFDYGFDKFGKSLEDMNDPKYDNPYDNERVLAEYQESKGETLQNLHDSWGKDCFGVEINDSNLKVTQMEGIDPRITKENCEEFYGQDIFERYSFYVGDIMTMKGITCYDGDESACAELGNGSNATQNTNTSTTVDGVTCPTELTENSSQAGYFKLPDAPNGEYDIVTPEPKRYGSKMLVCVLSTVGIAYGEKYEGKSKIQFNDLNATGHASHNIGIAVDLGARGEIGAADGTNAAYNKDATIELGKLFVDTGKIQNIWWCEPNGDGSTAAIKAYSEEKGFQLNIQCLPGHNNHFHVDIKSEYALPGSFMP